MHILVVEDNAAAAKSVELLLAAEGHNVTITPLGEDGIELAEIYEYDAVLLDLDLEDISGLEALREIRAKKLAVPVIMVSGSVDVDSKVSTLAAGADDYIAKPFHLREVLARIRSVLRRAAGNATIGAATVPAPPATPVNPSEERKTFSFGGWVLDVDARELFGPDGNPCHLTTGEFELLQVFVRHPNHVLTRDQIMDKVKGYDWTPTDRSIDNQVVRLRKKIEADPRNPRLLKTVRGAGYCFTATAS